MLCGTPMQEMHGCSGRIGGPACALYSGETRRQTTSSCCPVCIVDCPYFVTCCVMVERDQWSQVTYIKRSSQCQSQCPLDAMTCIASHAGPAVAPEAGAAAARVRAVLLHHRHRRRDWRDLSAGAVVLVSSFVKAWLTPVVWSLLSSRPEVMPAPPPGWGSLTGAWARRIAAKSLASSQSRWAGSDLHLLTQFEPSGSS